MATFKCKNFGSCSLADGGKEFEVALGGDDRCPECGVTLAPAAGSEPKGNPGGRGRLMPVGAAVVAVVILAGGVYAWRRSNQVVVLTPEPSSSATAASGPASATSAAPMAAASVGSSSAADEAKAAEPKPPEMNVGETAARLTCDEATRAKQPDAAAVCRRAAAITLLNSGAQEAVAGKLDQAEKDYLAAQDKDPDIPELYFNLAALKARQGKRVEALDDLTLAASKGFQRFDLIATEPAFAPLRADPALKARLEALSKK